MVDVFDDQPAAARNALQLPENIQLLEPVGGANHEERTGAGRFDPGNSGICINKDFVNRVDKANHSVDLFIEVFSQIAEIGSNEGDIQPGICLIFMGLCQSEL